LWVVEELLAVGPRLASRTRRQIEVLRRLGGGLPCVGAIVRPKEQVRVPAAEAPERVTVLDVLAEPQLAAPSLAAPVADAVAETDHVEFDEVPALTAIEVVPAADDLPITDYDSLAASQVVPRLATMSPGDLELVGAYERSHRNRQTILHRVAQLLSQ
jgi:hypothetical protein